MDCACRVGAVVIVGLAVLAGCGTSTSPDAATNAQQSPAIVVKNAADPATNPIARAAHDFLAAVIQGDKQASLSQLTPRAIEQIEASGKQFAPPGLDNASFQIGEVRTPSATQAVVQCLLSQKQADGTPKTEEMCCLLKMVDNQWRVSGIAANGGPGRPPMILDFETSPQPPQPGPLAGPEGQNGASPAVGRPSPPRTAQESPSPRY